MFFDEFQQLLAGDEVKNSSKIANLQPYVGINKLLVTSDNKSYGKNTKNLIAKIRRKQTHSKGHNKARIELKEYVNSEVKKMFDDHN